MPHSATTPARPATRHRRHRALAIVAIGLSGTVAWADAAPGGTRRADPMAQVLHLVGDAACRSDADCRTIGVGHRACGGPQRYLAWSAWRTSAHALQHAAAATRTPAPPTGEGMVSTCQVPVDPGARCAGAAAGQAGTCQLR